MDHNSPPKYELLVSLLWHSHCSSISTSSGSIQLVCVFNVLAEYDNLQLGFQKDFAQCLPLHRSCDYATDLIPNSPLPHAKLYKVSRAEQEHVCLASELIGPSTSPVGAGFFLINKKDQTLLMEKGQLRF